MASKKKAKDPFKELLKIGLTHTRIAKQIGISRRTLERWLSNVNRSTEQTAHIQMAVFTVIDELERWADNL